LIQDQYVHGILAIRKIAAEHCGSRTAGAVLIQRAAKALQAVHVCFAPVIPAVGVELQVVQPYPGHGHILSGALFPLENLPQAIYFISRIDPLTYGVDGLRGTIAGMNTFGVYNDLAVIGSLSVLVCMIGAFLFSKIEA
jgi:ABC-type polysaccharide/polyol phosphate export permease